MVLDRTESIHSVIQVKKQLQYPHKYEFVHYFIQIKTSTESNCFVFMNQSVAYQTRLVNASMKKRMMPKISIE